MLKQTTTGVGAIGLLSAPSGPLAEEALKRIRDRLDRDLPAGPYYTEEQFVKILGIDKKSLANKRSAERSATERRYPIPIRLGGCRQLQYPRSVIVDWLAREELESMSRTVHRCR